MEIPLTTCLVLSSEGDGTDEAVLSEYRHTCTWYSKAPEIMFNVASRQYQIHVAEMSK